MLLGHRCQQFSQKTYYDTKISEIEEKITEHDHSNKCITIKQFNKLAAENFIARLKQANVAPEADIDDFVEKTDFDDKPKKINKKVTSNKTKHAVTEKKVTDLTNKVHKYQKKELFFVR